MDPTKKNPKTVFTIQDAVDVISTHIGNEIRLATPLGLGKPNDLLNQLYVKAKSNPDIKLTIFTALSLNPPRPTSPLARRFFVPFRDRHWGKDYPVLQFAYDSQSDTLPPNIRVHEFYYQAGVALQSSILQRDYQSLNYTHVAETLLQSEVNVIVQLIAEHSSEKGRFSLSSNPDLTLDVVELFKREGRSLLMVGVVHPDLPFLGGDAEVGASFFDLLVQDKSIQHALFALPKMPVDMTDHLIGFYSSQLVADAGTIQIGIGSLSDAIVSSLLLRHAKNQVYASLVQAVWQNRASPTIVCSRPFSAGLYGLSEMVMDGFMHLRKAGILRRNIVDEKSGTRTYLHGAFFLGSKEFYHWLRFLSGEEFCGLRMTRVSKVNDLYDPNEVVLRRQRQNARFFNTCMQVNLLGGAASETLENGKVVSGVGGQFNFVSMAYELQGARSVLMLRSTRTVRGKRVSNIVWSMGHLTVPRHLRDIVVTEYGIADLRGKTDEETIKAMLLIADSEFQPELIRAAKNKGKLAADYQLPESGRQNTPAQVTKYGQLAQNQGTFQKYPFGSDFTDVEERLAEALEAMQEALNGSKLDIFFKCVWLLLQSLKIPLMSYEAELERMNLGHCPTISLRVMRRLLVVFLARITSQALSRSENA